MREKTWILQGTMRRRAIPLPPPVAGHQNITSQKVKEAAFQLIENRISHPRNTVFWDLFAGSGQMGFEALSRDFFHAAFSEWEEVRVRGIRKWLEQANISGRFSVIRSNSFKTLEKAMTTPPPGLRGEDLRERELVLYADPPYHLEKASLSQAARLLKAFTESSPQSIYRKAILMVQVPNSRRQTISKSTFAEASESFSSVYDYGKNSLLIAETP